MTAPPARIGFRHSDPRFAGLWQASSQPAARWHAQGAGPANYFADTPTGAWAEFLRHEGITDEADLAGIQRALWAVQLPPDGYAQPDLPHGQLTGSLTSHPTCQAEARRLRSAGATRLQAPSAALLPGGASGWQVAADAKQTPGPARDGLVWVVFGAMPGAIGWPVVDAGAPPRGVVMRVNALA